MTEGDPTIEREIFNEFQRANDEDVERLKQAVANNDPAEVKRLIHLIKGASAMIGALRLANVCESLERANRAGDWKTITIGMRNFQQEVADLNLYFTEFSRHS